MSLTNAKLTFLLNIYFYQCVNIAVVHLAKVHLIKHNQLQLGVVAIEKIPCKLLEIDIPSALKVGHIRVEQQLRYHLSFGKLVVQLDGSLFHCFVGNGNVLLTTTVDQGVLRQDLWCLFQKSAVCAKIERGKWREQPHCFV